MALSSSADLEGFAALQQTIVHTYVRSSCGASWGCWGGSTGGVRVCNGTGSSKEADCISQRGAGILYGVNGVCHQTANRILSPANIAIPLTIVQVRSSCLVSGNLAVICRGNRRGILGRGARLRVRRHLRDLLPVPRVLQFPNPQLRGADR